MANHDLPPQKVGTGWVILLHAIIIILIWISPFLFTWKLIVAGIILYYLQLVVVGDCILTRVQFKKTKREISFYYFVLTRLGFKPRIKIVQLLADYAFPFVILGIGLLWQLLLNNAPLVY